MRGTGGRVTGDEAAPDSHGRTLFLQGLLSAIANPKVLLFFGAFLPQFIDPQRALLPQFLVMATTFALSEFVTEYLNTCSHASPSACARGWNAPARSSTARAAASSS